MGSWTDRGGESGLVGGKTANDLMPNIFIFFFKKESSRKKVTGYPSNSSGYLLALLRSGRGRGTNKPDMGYCSTTVTDRKEETMEEHYLF